MSASSTPVGIIGGTGVYDPAWLQESFEQDVETPYGTTRVTGGRTGGRVVYFMNRHGAGHSVPPHRVNYRPKTATSAADSKRGPSVATYVPPRTIGNPSV